jgi:predicted esterase
VGSVGLVLGACASLELPGPQLAQYGAPMASARAARFDIASTYGQAAPTTRVLASAPATPGPVLLAETKSAPAAAPPAPESAEPAPPAVASTTTPPASADAEPAGRCASVPPLLPNGAVPPAPPHAPLGADVEVPGDRPAYVLPGDRGDPRVIIYLPGMCGDPTAADYFQKSARAHGTLISIRGDTPCDNGRFKWRDEPSKIQARIRAAFASVNASRGGELRLEQALLFGYSQGADRAEKVAALYPQEYPRVVLGGPPLKPSPRKLAKAERVVVFGGELETTENMRAGFEALQSAGITARWFTIECAYHGYFGTNAEGQFSELLDWVSQP